VQPSPWSAAPTQPQDGRRLSPLEIVVAVMASALVVAAVVFTVLAPVYPPRGRVPASLRSLLPAPSANSGSGGAANASPSAAPTAADPNRLPAAMLGSWTGVVTQQTSTFSEQYNVILTLTGGASGDQVGTSYYSYTSTTQGRSSWTCGGNLTLVRGGTNAQLVESFPAPTSCIGDSLTLSVNSGGQLVYHFPDAGYGVGDAILTRRS
jgi:hypothetical protein